jgi:hypothetical protein
MTQQLQNQIIKIPERSKAKLDFFLAASHSAAVARGSKKLGRKNSPM